MTFTRDDLTVLNNPLDFIRSHPQMFLRQVSDYELALRLVGGACLAGRAPVTVFRQGPWWVVAGEADWMTARPGLTADELFSRMVAFPEAGPNSAHPEVLLSALADVVITAAAGEVRLVKGTAPRDDPIWNVLRSRPEWKRVVAFRGPEGEAPQEPASKGPAARRNSP
jgi:hypothetical protein